MQVLATNLALFPARQARAEREREREGEVFFLFRSKSDTHNVCVCCVSEISLSLSLSLFSQPAVASMRVDLGRWLSAGASAALSRHGVSREFLVSPPQGHWPPPGWPEHERVFEPFSTPFFELRRAIAAAATREPNATFFVTYARRGAHHRFERRADGSRDTTAQAPVGARRRKTEGGKGLTVSSCLVYEKSITQNPQSTRGLFTCACFQNPSQTLSPSMARCEDSRKARAGLRRAAARAASALRERAFYFHVETKLFLFSR